MTMREPSDKPRALRGRAGRMRGGRGAGESNRGVVRLWGRHAVAAALANPERTLTRLWATREALAGLDGPPPAGLALAFAEGADLARLVARDAPHQGLVLECAPLPSLAIEDVIAADAAEAHPRPLIVLDQVTDPHNLGAILRSAAAFGAGAVITQDRHSPPESGVVARAASGALEVMAWVRVVNLARALTTLAEAGYWRIGLAGEAALTLGEALPAGPERAVALVLGAEGEGLRPNIAAHCDALARLPITPLVESLNVSNAAAVALYALSQRRMGLKTAPAPLFAAFSQAVR